MRAKAKRCGRAGRDSGRWIHGHRCLTLGDGRAVAGESHGAGKRHARGRAHRRRSPTRSWKWLGFSATDGSSEETSAVALAAGFTVSDSELPLVLKLLSPV